MALGNINNAPLKLNALVIQNIRVSPNDLTNRIVRHYTQAAIGRFHSILGSADFLGNPVGLVQ